MCFVKQPWRSHAASLPDPDFFLLRHFIKIHLEPRRLGVCTVVSEQLLRVLNTSFHTRAHPQNRVLPGLSVVSGSDGRIQALASLWDVGPLLSPLPVATVSCPGYHSNLVMLVAALPSPPPGATRCGATALPAAPCTVAVAVGQGFGGRGAGVTQTLLGVGGGRGLCLPDPGPPLWMAVGRKGLP